DRRDAGYARTRVATPVAIAARAVEHDDPGVTEPACRLAGRATLELCGIDIGHHAGVGVHHLALAVGGDGVDPGRAQVPQRAAHVRHTLGATVLQPLVEAARVVAVGVL